MFDPPISSAADIFIIISVILIAAVAAIVSVDVYKSTIFKKDTSDKK